MNDYLIVGLVSFLLGCITGSFPYYFFQKKNHQKYDHKNGE